jgi:protocatechuate 3,4-dioxygenase beta subunit
MKTRFSRRDFNRILGVTGAGLLVTPAIVEAGIASPPQTEGPFYPVVEQDDKDIDLTMIEGHVDRATGDVILVRGRVLNTDGNVLKGATVDVWQANHFGRYSHPEDTNPNPLDPDFQGWGIMQTGLEGEYGFKTVLPGPYDISPNAARCRHIHFKITHPDTTPLTTQMYFEGDPLIAIDTVMKNTPEELRPLLVAKQLAGTDEGMPVYQWDIVLG